MDGQKHLDVSSESGRKQKEKEQYGKKETVEQMNLSETSDSEDDKPLIEMKSKSSNHSTPDDHKSAVSDE